MYRAKLGYKSEPVEVPLSTLVNKASTVTENGGGHSQRSADINLGEYKPLVTVSTKQITNNQLQITITDNGPGIRDETKEKIFQPFFTTKNTGKGTGLGLSLAYDIVKAHGGGITVNSDLTKGTEFRIVLPIN